jgi:hypothetical protein
MVDPPRSIPIITLLLFAELNRLLLELLPHPRGLAVAHSGPSLDDGEGHCRTPARWETCAPVEAARRLLW